MPSVLFVCTGNIIRSPFAEHLFRNLIAESEDNLENWLIASTGIWTQAGLPAVKKAREVAREMGVNLDDHKSTPLSLDLLEKSNLVITMESGQKEAIRHEFKNQASKVIMLSELAGNTIDIEDPIGLDPSKASEVLGNIDGLIREHFDDICLLAAKDLN